MAFPTATPVRTPSPQEVGSAFIKQYYPILHRGPESAYKFYQDSSIISRPDSNGVMASATTTQAINDMILSMDYKRYEVKIWTADSQPSYDEGVIVLVTGCLIGTDKIPRKFTQTFFLAPQMGGFFVLNDVFRFLDESQPDGINQSLVSTTIDGAATDSKLTLVQDSHVPDPATVISEAKLASAEEASIPSENGGLVVQDKVTVDPPVQPHIACEIRTSIAQEDVPKKSYASIVKDMKGSASSKPVYVPTTKLQPAPTNPEKPFIQSTAPSLTPEVLARKNDTISESSNSSNSHEGHSIYIGNLPLNATARQVEEEFKKFGPIKPRGVQVRIHKFEHFCFGFIEFESPESMKAAIGASPVMIGDKLAVVREKRPKTRVSNGVLNNGYGDGGKGYNLAGRGGFWSDNYRGRASFNANQGYGKNEFKNSGENSGRSQHPPC
ncbi:nuclear transport factor 2-like [Phoenix dactylifera]|uniref:Nuclear transport factor 2-like n=1 Tax=Phoenix dactylifera TaxID=42345 RepID=A0A8B9A5Y1_PHODC|nr:nuclear transport factor 2-like [Phoenix dactylifera]XP_038982056.1 nuclear transport factor 2-like [Phoenix dactylifera]XP_038982058.1 nuclear transport factor 2-like [Phoenix dactylifera]